MTPAQILAWLNASIEFSCTLEELSDLAKKTEQLDIPKDLPHTFPEYIRALRRYVACMERSDIPAFVELMENICWFYLCTGFEFNRCSGFIQLELSDGFGLEGLLASLKIFRSKIQGKGRRLTYQPLSILVHKGIEEDEGHDPVQGTIFFWDSVPYERIFEYYLSFVPEDDRRYSRSPGKEFIERLLLPKSRYYDQRAANPHTVRAMKTLFPEEADLHEFRRSAKISVDPCFALIFLLRDFTDYSMVENEDKLSFRPYWLNYIEAPKFFEGFRGGCRSIHRAFLRYVRDLYPPDEYCLILLRKGVPRDLLWSYRKGPNMIPVLERHQREVIGKLKNVLIRRLLLQ